MNCLMYPSSKMPIHYTFSYMMVKKKTHHTNMILCPIVLTSITHNKKPYKVCPSNPPTKLGLMQ